ncbi:hypothetical protein [Pseudoalteromonas piratica]|uniref:Uncharacterized protein n=1 Tax=Pseudoalteromonas piratica TaxID=1348114 RepID=A0A0A7EGV4_9GAMM|nr:hypothetical protein [Pseudoalteromonas piratica]AIY65197.1 hypothetical protein OM33_08515 [Pseudoalteromonas piratica]
MSVSNLIAKLKDTFPTFSIVEAGGDNTQPKLDTSHLMFSSVKTVIPETETFRLNDNPASESCVINLVSSRPLEIDSRKIAHTDVYVTELRAKSRDESFALVATLKTMVETSEFALELTDWLQDYDSSSESFRQNIEVSFTVPASSGDSKLPAILVYELDTSASPSQSASRTRQQLTKTYGVIVLTNQGNMSSIKAGIENSLIGWCESDNHSNMELRKGNPLDIDGRLSMYRYVFENSYTHKSN